MIFAGIFRFVYLPLAIFFGCFGLFMHLFRGEMSNRALHDWFLAPARREVLLVGKYAAGLTASAAIFGGGALLAFAAMLWPHDAVEIQAYWHARGMGHALWSAATAALGWLGCGRVCDRLPRVLALDGMTVRDVGAAGGNTYDERVGHF